MIRLYIVAMMIVEKGDSNDGADKQDPWCDSVQEMLDKKCWTHEAYRGGPKSL